MKLGKVVEIPEKDFDLFSALFGCGPAFLLEIYQVFKAKMKSLGLSDETENELLTELIEGTTSYLKNNQNEASIEELRKRITSKEGVTEAGVNYFKANKIDELFGNVITAAEERSREMGEAS